MVVGIDCNNTVKWVLRIIEYYTENENEMLGFIDTVMVREFVRRRGCHLMLKDVNRICRALACIAVRHGGDFVIIGRELWIRLPVRTISKLPRSELIRAVYECTKKRAWLELKKAKKVL